jgi:hypothetical protein
MWTKSRAVKRRSAEEQMRKSAEAGAGSDCILTYYAKLYIPTCGVRHATHRYLAEAAVCAQPAVGRTRSARRRRWCAWARTRVCAANVPASANVARARA